MTWYVTSPREDAQPSCSSEAGCSSSQTAGKTCRDDSSQCRRSVTVSSELLHSFELDTFSTNTSHPNANQSCTAVQNSLPSSFLLSAPEIDRSEKPGRKKMMPQPPACSVPAPSLVSNFEEGKVTDQLIVEPCFQEISIKHTLWALLLPPVWIKSPTMIHCPSPVARAVWSDFIHSQPSCAMWVKLLQQLWLHKQGRLPPAGMTLSVPRLALKVCTTSSKVKTDANKITYKLTWRWVSEDQLNMLT